MVSKDTSFDYLPCEINKYIYDIVCLDNTPLFNYRMRFINREFKSIVDNHNGKICRDKIDTELDKLISFGGNIRMFKWLFDHEIYMNYKDVSSLISCHRIDILKLMMDYGENEKILFNRFYLSDGNISENFSIFRFGIVNRSFLLLACECGDLEIVKFFLESPKKKIYILQVNAVLDISFINNSRHIIDYIYENYKYKINNKNIKKIII
jgi:hypothetical protein